MLSTRTPSLSQSGTGWVIKEGFVRRERFRPLDICRFARFQADRERYQLWREGRTIKLERIPLELLFLLLENTGRLVSRAQIVARIWGDDVFVDTERSINTAVRKLRKALEDDPHHPQLIETVVGKGYRFIGALIPERRLNDSSFATGSNEAQPGNNEIRLRDFSIETTSAGARPDLRSRGEQRPIGPVASVGDRTPGQGDFPGEARRQVIAELARSAHHLDRQSCPSASLFLPFRSPERVANTGRRLFPLE